MLIERNHLCCAPLVAGSWISFAQVRDCLLRIASKAGCRGPEPLALDDAREGFHDIRDRVVACRAGGIRLLRPLVSKGGCIGPCRPCLSLLLLSPSAEAAPDSDRAEGRREGDQEHAGVLQVSSSRYAGSYTSVHS